MGKTECIWSYDRFKHLLENAGLNPYRLAELLGLWSEELERCYGTRYGYPALSTVVRVADFFAVPIDFLTGRCTEEEAKNLLENYAKSVKTIRASFGQAFEEPWPYNLITDLYFEPLDGPLTDDQQKGLDHALSKLDSRERNIIIIRYQTKDAYAIVARRWGVTLERVRQLYTRAMSKLRAPLNRSMILLGLERSRKEGELAKREQEIAAAWVELEQEQDQINSLRAKFGEEKMRLLEKSPERMRHEVVLEQIGIEKLGLSLRAYNCLTRHVGVRTVAELIKKSKKDLQSARTLGPTTYEEIVRKTRQFTGIEAIH